MFVSIVFVFLWIVSIFLVTTALDIKNSRYVPHDQDRTKARNRTEELLETTDLAISNAYLAICLVVKDELDLYEWMDYHHAMGIGKFYVFDHNSDIPIINSIKEFVRSGVAEYSVVTKYSFPHMLKRHKAGQMFLYDECIKRYRNRHMFIGFIDSDEYIVVVNKTQSITDVLKDYESYGGLTLNWHTFGTSGHKTRPLDGVLASYHKCYPSFTVKTLVNMKFGSKCNPHNPHEFSYSGGKFPVDTNKQIVFNTSNPDQFHPPPMNSSLFKVMYINHYNTKSEEDYKIKESRGTFSLYEHPANYTAIMDKKAYATCPPVWKPEKPFPLRKRKGAAVAEPLVPLSVTAPKKKPGKKN